MLNTTFFDGLSDSNNYNSQYLQFIQELIKYLVSSI